MIHFILVVIFYAVFDTSKVINMKELRIISFEPKKRS